MRALVVSGPGAYGLQEVPVPEPGLGEVLIRSRSVGVSRTFMDVLRGRVRSGWVRYPVVPGHEWSGTVEAVGDGSVGEIRPGDRVVVEGLHYCGLCTYCRRGLTNLCVTYDQMGFTRPGGCAEYLTAPARFVHRLPPSVSFEAAALIEPAAVAMRGVMRGRPELSDTVAVIGPGTIGLLAVQILRLFSPSRIILIGLTSPPLELGRQLGATALVNGTETDPVGAVLELTGGVGADMVFDAAGTPSSLEMALHIVRDSGRVVFEGLPHDREPMAVSDLLSVKDLELHCVLSYTSQVWAQVVQRVAGGTLRLEPIIRHRIPLPDFHKALALMDDPTQALGKIILLP